MKPSSLATVLLRLAALGVAISGAFTLCAAVLCYLLLNYMTGENGPPSTLTGKVMGIDFQASSIGMIFTVQVIVGLAEMFGAYLLFRFSLAAGLLIGRGLDPEEETGAGSEEPKYYLMANQKSTGPFRLSELLRRLHMGTLRGNAQVRCDGGRWVPLYTLDV